MFIPRRDLQTRRPRLKGKAEIIIAKQAMPSRPVLTCIPAQFTRFANMADGNKRARRIVPEEASAAKYRAQPVENIVDA